MALNTYIGTPLLYNSAVHSLPVETNKLTKNWSKKMTIDANMAPIVKN